MPDHQKPLAIDTGNHSTPDHLTFWNLPETLAGSGMKRSAWYAAVRAGEAPQPVKVTGKRVAWIKAEVLDFRRKLIQRRNAAATVTIGAQHV